MTTAADIARSCRDEAARLRTYAERLERLAALLDSDVAPAPATREATPLLKANGEPYKRKPRSAAANAKMLATRRANARAKRKRSPLPELDAHRRERAQLHVISSTHPTEAELEGREVAHTTEAPAQAS